MFKLKEYNSLKGYLERFTILNIGRLHIRIHKILSSDATPFLHNHPFHYISFVYSGGYTEQSLLGFKKYPRFSIIIHKASFFHRFDDVLPNTKTLFFSWKTNQYKWQLKKAPIISEKLNWIEHKPGIYLRELNNGKKYCKFDVFWFKGQDTPEEALKEESPSNNQTKQGVFVQDLLQIVPTVETSNT